MLKEIETRGRDATGVAWWRPPNRERDGWECWYQKLNKPASQFVGAILAEKNAPTAIAHTRAMTKGSSNKTVNNHPVIAGNVLGIHNGVCRNDWSIFNKLKDIDPNLGIKVERKGEVDTEAIFAAIAYGTMKNQKGESVIADDVMGVLEMLEGTAALAWLYTYGPKSTRNDLHLARVSTSPLLTCHIKDGSLLFASTEATLHKGAKAAHQEIVGDIEEHKEGTYLHVLNGEVVETVYFTPKKGYVQGFTYGPGWHGGAGGHHTYSPPPKDSDHDITHYQLRRMMVFSSEVKTMAVHQVNKEYGKRHRATDDWIRDHKHTNEDAAERGAKLEIGTWVYTTMKFPDVADPVQVLGQIALMPQTFPSGYYFVRVFWPVGPKEWEECLVPRAWEEMEMVPDEFEEEDKTEPEKAEPPAGDLRALEDIPDEELYAMYGGGGYV